MRMRIECIAAEIRSNHVLDAGGSDGVGDGFVVRREQFWVKGFDGGILVFKRCSERRWVRVVHCYLLNGWRNGEVEVRDRDAAVTMKPAWERAWTIWRPTFPVAWRILRLEVLGGRKEARTPKTTTFLIGDMIHPPKYIFCVFL